MARAPSQEHLGAFYKRSYGLDDTRARTEWGRSPSYDLDAMVDDFLEEMRSHRERYA